MEDYGKFKMYMFCKRNGCVQCRHDNYLRYFNATYSVYRSYFLKVETMKDSCF